MTHLTPNYNNNNQKYMPNDTFMRKLETNILNINGNNINKIKIACNHHHLYELKYLAENLYKIKSRHKYQYMKTPISTNCSEIKRIRFYFEVFKEAERYYTNKNKN